jgi:Fur family zinc uptake transcriptional regulator
MRKKTDDLSTNDRKVLALLGKSAKPMSAYAILDKLRGAGVKAPPTVYRALEALMKKGLVHRIASLNAFVACHNEEADHGTQFAVCRGCGTTLEIHDHRICDAIREIGARLKFRVEKEMLELLGQCQRCAKADAA